MHQHSNCTNQWGQALRERSSVNMKLSVLCLWIGLTQATAAWAEELVVPEFTIVNLEACAVDQNLAAKRRCGGVDHEIIITERLIAANPTIEQYARRDDDGTLWLPPWHIIAHEPE